MAGAVEGDEAVGGTVVLRVAAVEFGFDGFGEFFAVFDAPLVEGVDAPNRALDEGAVFVCRHEHAEAAGVGGAEEEAVARAVAGELFLRSEAFAFGFGQVGKFGAGFFEGFAFHQGFGLGEGVGDGETVLAVDAVGGGHGDDEVAGDEPCALVEELEIGVLAVDAFFTENDTAGGMGDGASVGGAVFAEALHVELVEPRGEVAQVVAVWDGGLPVGVLEVVVPDADERHEDGDVAAVGGLEEVGVHGVCAGEEFAEAVCADGDHDGQADGRPDGIASADPVEHGEDVVGCDAEVPGGGNVGGDGAEVAVDAGFGQPCVPIPCAGGVGVEQGFGRAEGFAGDAEYGGLGFEVGECAADVGVV